MKKVIMFLIIFSGLMVSASGLRLHTEEEKSILEEFSLKPYASLGFGTQPMTIHGPRYYGNVKIFPLHYGPEDIGMSFFGVGYSFTEYTSGGSFSPLGLRAKNWVVAIDIHANRADFVGVSISYYIPLNFP